MNKAMFCLLLLVPFALQAAQFKGGYVACLAKELLGEVNEETRTADLKRLAPFFDLGVCIVTKPGDTAEMIGREQGSHGEVVKLRRLQGEREVIFWTYAENIVSEEDVPRTEDKTTRPEEAP